MTSDTDIRVGVYCYERRAGKASLDDAQRMARSMEGQMRVQSIRLYVDVETEGRRPRPERTRLLESCKEGGNKLHSGKVGGEFCKSAF